MRTRDLICYQSLAPAYNCRIFGVFRQCRAFILLILCKMGLSQLQNHFGGLKKFVFLSAKLFQIVNSFEQCLRRRRK